MLNSKNSIVPVTVLVIVIVANTRGCALNETSTAKVDHAATSPSTTGLPLNSTTLPPPSVSNRTARLGGKMQSGSTMMSSSSLNSSRRSKDFAPLPPCVGGLGGPGAFGGSPGHPGGPPPRCQDVVSQK